MLYIVPTPIGNLNDITLRAIETLKNADLVLCEDTRTSGILLNHFGIKKELRSYHKFNEKKSLEDIIKKLQDGVNIALISDAGMPGISDPGEILIREVISKKIKYTVLPGASAVTTAFVLSGFETPFVFIGFLPEKKGERTKILQSFANTPASLIFYVSPHKLDNIISEMYSVFGERKACAVREISKKFEEVRFFNLKEGFDGLVKGEFVLLLDKPTKVLSLNSLSIDEHVKHYVELGQPKNDAMKLVAKDRGVSKSEIYNKLVKK